MKPYFTWKPEDFKSLMLHKGLFLYHNNFISETYTLYTFTEVWICRSVCLAEEKKGKEGVLCS